MKIVTGEGKNNDILGGPGGGEGGRPEDVDFRSLPPPSRERGEERGEGL